jgi:hypothetical protein
MILDVIVGSDLSEGRENSESKPRGRRLRTGRRTAVRSSLTVREGDGLERRDL